MRTLGTLSILPAALLITGCGSNLTTYVHTDSTLGRVVVYKSGVAYFERTAKVDEDHLTMKVPGDKVDDFLKSLTVVDAETGKPAPISYPTRTNTVSANGLVEMKIGLGAPKSRVLKLTYVTEAPSWKPSYRVVVQKDGKVDLQAWAIVDNTSGEDWTNVKLGVGSSSALSFRYDLGSIRFVQRETLSPTDLFAYAPPTGGATYNGQAGAQQQRVVGMFGDKDMAGAIAQNEINKKPKQTGDGQPVVTGRGAGAGAHAMGAGAGNMAPPATGAGEDARVVALAKSLQNARGQIVVEGFAKADDHEKETSALDRANALREELIKNGVDPNRVVAVSRGQQAGFDGGARVLEAAPPPPAAGGQAQQTPKEANADPIGTSHFESHIPMNVPKGTSAMVSIMETKTDGEMVYLYDPESPRGNAQYPFRAVRLKNASDSTLESGPVTVFGDGKFIGEGIAEPIPSGSIAFVPFALDRQVIVEHKDGERDDIARIIKVNRGVFSTEVQHVKKTVLEMHNRMAEPATVYVKHSVPQGYKLLKAPEGGDKEKLEGAQLAKVTVPANGSAEVVFEEATPVMRSVDVRTPQGLGQVKLFLTNGAQQSLKKQVEDLLKLEDDMAKIQEQIQSQRDQQAEYKSRIDELHTQIFTLKAVKSAGPLMTSLEKKMQEFSDKSSKATIDIVNLQEKLMISRVHFEDGVAELSLEPKTKDEKPKTASTK